MVGCTLHRINFADKVEIGLTRNSYSRAKILYYRSLFTIYKLSSTLMVELKDDTRKLRSTDVGIIHCDRVSIHA